MASWGETSLLDYSLEREGGHDEPWDFCNLDEDPLFSLWGGQKIRIKAACSTAGIALWADLIRAAPVSNLFFGRVRESGKFETFEPPRLPIFSSEECGNQERLKPSSQPDHLSLLRKGAVVRKARNHWTGQAANLFFGGVR